MVKYLLLLKQQSLRQYAYSLDLPNSMENTLMKKKNKEKEKDNIIIPELLSKIALNFSARQKLCKIRINQNFELPKVFAIQS